LVIGTVLFSVEGDYGSPFVGIILVKPFIESLLPVRREITEDFRQPVHVRIF
jgi:hypothetical protein